jgi:hypothetical protein
MQKGDYLMALTRRMGFMETNRVESILRDIDESAVKSTGISLFHILTVGSIAASITLFVSGRK